MLALTLDSNVYISGLEFGGVGFRLIDMARAGAVRIDVSPAILDEVIQVLRSREAGKNGEFGCAKAISSGVTGCR